ncbi:hypothetical protein ACH3XW_31355 [Acanthocheilonema viteae]
MCSRLSSIMFKLYFVLSCWHISLSLKINGYKLELDVLLQCEGDEKTICASESFSFSFLRDLDSEIGMKKLWKCEKNQIK